jgi:glutamate synthase domain-containing protein 2
METLLLPFSPRYIILTICAVVTALLVGIGIFDAKLKVWELLAIPIVVFGALTVLGIRDLTQKNHAVLRNYPISAHIRFLLEEIRPEMRQYFFESEKDGMPFSRDTRALVYQRAKMVLDKRPFGTQEDVYRDGYEWLHHSMLPKPRAVEQFRVTIGGPECTKPYSASVFNISAMSFGALSPNAVRALNAGAKKGAFAHDTGEGGVSPYHREHGGDIIWEIGSGYFGCRNRDGSFNPEQFARVASDDQIKMVELKVSQGAKPGHGGVLPRPRYRKRSPRFAACRWARIAFRPRRTARSRRRLK